MVGQAMILLTEHDSETLLPMGRSGEWGKRGMSSMSLTNLATLNSFAQLALVHKVISLPTTVMRIFMREIATFILLGFFTKPISCLSLQRTPLRITSSASDPWVEQGDDDNGNNHYNNDPIDSKTNSYRNKCEIMIHLSIRT